MTDGAEQDAFTGERFRARLGADLGAELAVLPAPPLGDLVGDATRAGRRTRRRRTAAAVAGSVTAVAALALLLTGLPGGGPQRPAAVA
ncbi:hypothetical protein ACFW1A_30935, partial [Kitasatospora sp. NPDC058965]